jgi:hypothetical protein
LIIPRSVLTLAWKAALASPSAESTEREKENEEVMDAEDVWSLSATWRIPPVPCAWPALGDTDAAARELRCVTFWARAGENGEAVTRLACFAAKAGGLFSERVGVGPEFVRAERPGGWYSFLSDPGEGMDTEERSVSVGEKGELRPNAEGFLPEETRRLEFGVVALAFLSFPTGTYSLVLSIVMTGTRGC